MSQYKTHRFLVKVFFVGGIMKYIRTKDGIFAFEGVNTITKVYETPKGIKPWSYSDGTLVKEGDKFIHVNNKDYKVDEENTADTIEELCDVFVYETNENNHYIKDKHNTIQLFFDNEKPIAYYGAIWTDKGLIYVAKMNDKGELELL